MKLIRLDKPRLLTRRSLLRSTLIAAPAIITLPHVADAQFGACLPGFCGANCIKDPNIVFLASFEQAQCSSFSYFEQSIIAATVTYSAVCNDNSASQSDISNLQAEYGASSARSDNTTAGNAPFNSAYWLSDTNATQLTIEYSYYQTNRAVASNYQPFNFTTLSSGNFSWIVRHSGPDYIFFWSSDGTTFQSLTAAGAVGSINTWVKYAVTKDNAGTFRIFVNGTQVANSTPADSTFFHGVNPLVINSSAPGQTAYLDNARITKNLCHYTGNYTPAT